MKVRFLALTILCACNARALEADAAEQAAPSAKTRWLEAEPVTRLSLLEAPARVLPAPNSSALVSAPLAARVLRARVRPGQTVEANDPLVELLVPDAVRAAGELAAARLRVEAYERRRAKLAPLVEQGLARTADLTELDAALSLARADSQTARATLRSAGVSDRQAALLLEGDGTLVLRAPLAGMVTSVTATPGESCDAQKPLVAISGTSDVQLEARFAVQPPKGSRFEWLSTDGQVPLELEALSPRAEPEDGSRKAWLRVAEAHDAPTAGALGTVRIVPEKDWVALPSGSLEESAGSAFVNVLDREHTERRKVRVILRSASTSVVAGVAPGTLVASDAEALHGGGP